ncbi:hypothetical protein AB0478_17670 [Streptomyces sp. NPDC051917]|uniref:hypothetical protein n=1 Tax=Streptomyces sp. NPDC051917 TaxID=3154754 RepID=UPI00344ED5C8
MTGADRLLTLLDERESALDARSDVLRAGIAELTEELAELASEAEAVRITRKTILALAPQLEESASEPPPDLPPHPHYPEILTALAQADRPLRARDLCERLGLGYLPRTIEGVRAKAKRLVARGLVDEPEPGQFAPAGPRTDADVTDQPT